MISNSKLTDNDRMYKPATDESSGISGTLIPRAKDGFGGGSFGFDPNKLIPYTVISPECPGGVVVDPNTLAPVESYPLSEEKPKDNGAAKKFLSQLGFTNKIIEPKKSETIKMDGPAIPIKFSGAFGEIDTYYFDVSEQNKMLVLVWDKSYRGSKYTPPVPRDGAPPEPLDVTFKGQTYRVANYNLKFDLPSVNLEILVLLIVDQEDN